MEIQGEYNKEGVLLMYSWSWYCEMQKPFRFKFISINPTRKLSKETRKFKKPFSYKNIEILEEEIFNFTEYSINDLKKEKYIFGSIFKL